MRWKPLQCLTDNRPGGETGVAAVTCLTGREVWRAADSGRWSWSLLDAALAHSSTANLGDVRANTGTMAVAGMPATPPLAFLVEYTDGTRGSVLLLNGHVQDVTAAVTDGHVIRARRVRGPATAGLPALRPAGGRAGAVLRNRPPGAPIDRTLLTTGLLTAAMHSHANRGVRVDTPDLAFGYAH